MTLTTPEPCGAIRVVRWFEGMAQVEAWCSRTHGPCHYPGAGVSLLRNGRLCIVEFAKLNGPLVRDEHHGRHGGMFPETCSLCEEEAVERSRGKHPPTTYDPAGLTEEMTQ